MQRILDAIDKGTKLSDVTGVIIRHDGMVLPASEELRRLVERVNGERSLDEVSSAAAADDPGQADVYRLLAQLMARLHLVVPG